LDQTPVVDIKPYISYSDLIENSADGFATPPASTRDIKFTRDAEDFCVQYEKQNNRVLRRLIAETLALDPRPASQRHGKQSYGMALWDVNVRFQVVENTFVVERIELVKGEGVYESHT